VRRTGIHHAVAIRAGDACQFLFYLQEREMNRKIVTLLTILLLALALVACGGGAAPDAGDEPDVVEEETPAEEEAPAEETPAEEEAPAEEPPAEEPSGETLGTEENPIVMSFVPSGDTQEIIASGEEIAMMLEESTGLQIEANVATSYAAVVEAMCAGNAPVGWLNTFSYVLAVESCGVDVSLATVRFGTPYYTGQIVAGADTGIESIEDIDPANTTVCWVDPLSTSGYIIPSIMLAAAGLDVDAMESVETGSHPAAITGVYNGECDIGASFVDARTSIEEEFPDVMERVNVIAISPEIPNDTVAFSPDVPEDIRQQIVTGLLELAETEEGLAALEQVYEIEGFEEVDDSFYDAFRTELDASGINIEDLAGE
jgi:phosphonate transport system substrate-binding protein